MANGFKWVVGLAFVSYVGVMLFLKVVQSERTQKSDPVLVEKLELLLSELDGCRATNEKLRRELEKQAVRVPD